MNTCHRDGTPGPKSGTIEFAQKLPGEIADMKVPFSGRCLCGAVSYTCTAEPHAMVLCQCDHCRKTSGTGHSAGIVVPKDAVTFDGPLKIFAITVKNGNLVGRGFCPNCGSPLLARSSGMPERVLLRPSTLDSPDDAPMPAVVVWTQDAAPWDHIDPDLPAFDTVPPASES